MDSSALKITDDVFSSEEKILGLLVTIRNSALPPEDKATVRDLILDYAGTTDETKRSSLKEEIKRRFPESGSNTKTETQPVTETVKKSTPPHQSLGMSRPIPSFTVHNTLKETPKIVDVPKVEVPKIEVPEPTPIKKAEPVTIPKVVPAIAPEAKPAVTTEVPKEVAAPLPKPEPISATPNTEAKTRINQIKHDINERVGNPINLINADEAIGREYMTALLDAMKAANAGDPSTSKSIDRLESAYQKVNELLSHTDVSLAKKIKVTSETTTPKPATVEKAPETQTSPIMSGLPSREKGGGLNIQKVEAVSPLTTPVKAPEVETEAKEAAPVDKLIPVSSATTLPEKIETVRQKSENREKEANRPVSDLDDERVTAGLKQLLSEWKLFKQKSWFGGGSTGMDHPLYKQLANLPMAAVISGRFEGSTPETKYLISDYLTGWRYEQGVTYESGETFEHYLRRVILEILSKQKQSVPTKKP